MGKPSKEASLEADTFLKRAFSFCKGIIYSPERALNEVHEMTQNLTPEHRAKIISEFFPNKHFW